jgi:hypothetical protein
MNEHRNNRMGFLVLRRRAWVALGLVALALTLVVILPSLTHSAWPVAEVWRGPWRDPHDTPPARPHVPVTANQRAAAALALAQQATGLTQLAHSRALRQTLHEAKLDAAAGWTQHAGVDLDRLAEQAGLLQVATRSLGTLLLCDSSGQVLGGRLAAGQARASLPTSVAHWPVFAAARQGLALSEVTLPLAGQSPHVPSLQFEMGLPVLDERGRTRGVLIATLDERAWTGSTAFAPTADELACAHGRCPPGAALAWDPRALAVWLQEAPGATPRLWSAATRAGLHGDVSSQALPSQSPVSADADVPHWLRWGLLTVALLVTAGVCALGLRQRRLAHASWADESELALLTTLPGRPRHTLGAALKLEVERRRLQVVQPGSPFCLVSMLAPGSEDVHFPDDVAQAALWVAHEALNNALRGGHLSDLVVHLHAYDRGLRMEVHDTGPGLLGKSATRLVDTGWPRDLGQHASLDAMRDRSAAIGARLTVRSEPYSGTRIVLRWLP